MLLSTSTLIGAKNTYRDNMQPDNKIPTVSSLQADSIMQQLIANAKTYQKLLAGYEAEIYTKGRTTIPKHNTLIRLAHHLFPVDWKNENMIFEMVSNTQYAAPNNFLYNFKAINGNSIPNEQKQKEALTFISVNFYSPIIYNQEIITPINEKASKYYTYNLKSVSDTSGIKIYKINFQPKIWNQKLINGDLYIRDGSWMIDKIDINGRFDFAEFHLTMTYGRDAQYQILPDKANLTLFYKALGNQVATQYHSSFTYNQVEWTEEDVMKEDKSLDLTSYYQLSTDTVPFIQDTLFWDKERDIPLTTEEKQLYKASQTKQEEKPDTSELQQYLKLTEKVTSSINMDYKSTRIKYSGLFNPFQLGFSGEKGITYRQQLRISKTFDRDRQLRFNPEIGFVFKRKEVFFTVAGEWEYKPEKRGTLSLKLGNGNRTYSSAMNEVITQLKDTAINFDDLDLEYFKHYYSELRNNIELFNGFELQVGLAFHHRILAKDYEMAKPHQELVPIIGFTYTPRQYYWMDGYRKEYLYSSYPTLSVELARAIPGKKNLKGDYTRIEADIQQSIPLGLTSKLNYHLSGGAFINPQAVYFADFRYFADHQFPESWGDKFGGRFNKLDRDWYNASNKYVQGHVMLDSPFLLSQLFKRKLYRHVVSERVYLSQLWTPALPCYTEIGYGVGNHILNIAFFGGFEKGKFDSIGFKFAFELFQ